MILNYEEFINEASESRVSLEKFGPDDFEKIKAAHGHKWFTGKAADRKKEYDILAKQSEGHIYVATLHGKTYMCVYLTNSGSHNLWSVYDESDVQLRFKEVSPALFDALDAAKD